MNINAPWTYCLDGHPTTQVPIINNWLKTFALFQAVYIGVICLLSVLTIILTLADRWSRHVKPIYHHHDHYFHSFWFDFSCQTKAGKHIKTTINKSFYSAKPWQWFPDLRLRYFVRFVPLCLSPSDALVCTVSSPSSAIIGHHYFHLSNHHDDASHQKVCSPWPIFPSPGAGRLLLERWQFAFDHQNQEGFSDMIWMLMAIVDDKGELVPICIVIKILPSYKSYTWDLVGQATSSELFSMESGLLSLAK